MITGLGLFEMGVVFVLLLLLFGPQELPHLARGGLRILNELKGVFHRLQKEWNLESKTNNKDNETK